MKGPAESGKIRLVEVEKNSERKESSRQNSQSGNMICSIGTPRHRVFTQPRPEGDIAANRRGPGA
jgi:hypothetical protein